MRNIIAIKIDSIIDVITNSSSELFIIDDNKTIEQVEEILRALLEEYNKLAEMGAYGKYAHPTIYEHAFGRIHVYTKEECEQDKKEIKRLEKEYGKSYSYGYEGEKSNIGKIFIHSKEDNSIPYEMFDMIENMFSASRYHLG